MVYHFCDKNTSGGGVKNKIVSSQHPSDLPTEELAEELQKLIIRKFENYINLLWTIFLVLI